MSGSSMRPKSYSHSLGLGLGILALFPYAHAAEFWDDFTNNLATDVAPIISLFGEQTTKQFLSESVTWSDYFIFAMAPLGILTAVVSAIRVCGSPSLRAFIGRAQEGAAVTEAELCSSTSRNVGELYNNGGIARVFGRPKILEVVMTENPNSPVETFAQYLRSSRGRNEWSIETSRVWTFISGKYRLRKQVPYSPDNVDHNHTAFAPNLSLNLGIKRHSRLVNLTAAVAAFVLQSGVITYGAVATYHLQLRKDNEPVESYAFPLMYASTAVLAFGIWLCAFLVGHSTNETFYTRQTLPPKAPSALSWFAWPLKIVLYLCKPAASTTPQPETQSDVVPASSTMYWLQPGNQVLGDQYFEAFSATRGAEMGVYVKSEKAIRGEKIIVMEKVVTYAAIFITLGGWIGQFVGLRGCHGTVSLAQLGVTLIVSGLRALLRTQRLKPEDNLLRRLVGVVVGHELDWLALRICHDAKVLEGIAKGADDNPYRVIFTPNISSRIDIRPPGEGPHNMVETVLRYRAALARLTMSPDSDLRLQATPTRIFDDKAVEMRLEARKLAAAMGAALDILFDGSLELQDGFAPVDLTWKFSCTVATNSQPVTQSSKTQEDNGKHVKPKGGDAPEPLSRPDQPPASLRKKEEEVTMGFFRDGMSGGWKVANIDQVEALLGLWLWSIVGDTGSLVPDPESQMMISQARTVPRQQIVSVHERDLENFRVWCGRAWTPFDRESLHPAFRCAKPEVLSPGMMIATKSYGTYRGRESQCRYFGWYVPELPPLEKADGADASRPAAFTTVRKSSLNAMCTQEVFGHFLKAAIARVNDFGECSIVINDQHVEAQNRSVTGLIKAFTENGLGTWQDGSLCILSCVIKKLKLSSIDGTVETATKAVAQSLSMGDYYNAERVLRWVWELYESTNSNTPAFFRLATALCELYRKAMGDGNTRQIGRDGMDWLAAKYPPSSPEISSLVERYLKVREAFSEIENNKVDYRDSLCLGFESDQMSEARILALLTLYFAKDRAPLNDGVFYAGLDWAAKNGQMEVLNTLLESEPAAHVDPEEYSPRSALWHAADTRHLDVARVLIHHGALPGRLCSEGDSTPFLAAVHRLDIDIAAAMIPTIKPADFYVRSKFDQESPVALTALHYAVVRNNVDMVRLLLPHGAKHIDQNAFPDLDCLLAVSVRSSCSALAAGEQGPIKDAIEILKMLANSQTDFDVRTVQSPKDRTVLQLATSLGQVRVFEILIDAGALPRVFNDEDWCGRMMVAVESGSVPLVRYMIELVKTRFTGPEFPPKQWLDTLHARSVGGQSMLWHAVQKVLVKDDANMAALLFDHGFIKPEALGEKGQPVTHWLARHGQGTEILQFAIDKFGGDINSISNKQTTTLGCALEGLVTPRSAREVAAKSAIFRYLVGIGADIEQAVTLLIEEWHRNGEDDAPSLLHKAAAYGIQELPEILPFCSKILNQRDNIGRTPLIMSAVSPLGQEAQKTLIAAGADPDICGIGGVTSRKLARAEPLKDPFDQVSTMIK